MAEELLDGTMVQEGMRYYSSDADKSSVSQTGVVIHAYPADDPNNKFSQGTEYDVMLGNRQMVRCRSVYSITGYKNGWDIPHNPTTTTLDGTPLDIYSTPLANMDGDHVRVAFPYDDAQLGYIVNRVPHPGSKLQGASSSIASRKNRPYLRHENTEIWVDGQGEVHILTQGSNAKRVVMESESAKATIEKDHVRVEVGDKEVDLTPTRVKLGKVPEPLFETTDLLMQGTSPEIKFKGTTSFLVEVGAFEIQVKPTKILLGEEGINNIVIDDFDILVGAEEDLFLVGKRIHLDNENTRMILDSGLSEFVISDKTNPLSNPKRLAHSGLGGSLDAFFTALKPLLTTWATTSIDPASVTFATALALILPSNLSQQVTSKLLSD